MSTYGTDPATGTTGGTDTSTTDKAKDTAATAADEGRHVAATAKDEALDVAGTAAQQARTVVGDARQQVTHHLNEQATSGRDKLSETLRTFGDDLQQMAEGQGPAQGMAADLAREVSDRVRALGSHLENRQPGDLLDDARDFARRRPGTFLLGALATGVVAGRLLRGTADGAAAASLADSGAGSGAGDAGVLTTGVGTTGAGTTGAAVPATGEPDYTAPVPSLDEHTGVGYGTGPGGAGMLGDEPPTGTDTSLRDTP